MSTVALPHQNAAHEARYEQLREAGTNRQVMASRDGMAVVVQHGLAAWMQLCAKLPTPRAASLAGASECDRAARGGLCAGRAGAQRHGAGPPPGGIGVNALAHQKVNDGHLRRDAYLYIRQSTVRQVFENTESTMRQYALRDRAVALGWPSERVIVIDSDLGQSGASGAERAGFQRLVGEVGTGKAGIVLGLEVSRLARNSSDWHRLLEICALTDTLILDEDGLYNPADFNDRLLLGLKGTMSEAELHVLRARLRGGVLNAARRGALRLSLPVGLVYEEGGAVVLDPDAQVRGSLEHLFATFRRTGSASATVKHFREQDLRFPRRPRNGPHQGEVVWEPLRLWRVLRVLHNPRYAGIYCFGRTRRRKLVGGAVEFRKLPREQWTVRLPDAHPGYITAEQYEANLRQLRDNAQAHGAERRQSPPREGAALLQGLVICGVCGRRMTVRYRSGSGRQSTEYVCQYEGNDTASRRCQIITGHRDRSGHRRVAAADGVAGEPRGGPSSPGRVGRTHPRSRRATSAAGRAGALRSRRGATPVHARRSRQPPGGRCAGSGVEREAAWPAARAGRTPTTPTGGSSAARR